jgi:hypothetical protein
VRFEEWLASARPTDEESARVAWDAAIQAASELKKNVLTNEEEERAITDPGDPDGANKVVANAWEVYRQLILMLKTHDRKQPY